MTDLRPQPASGPAMRLARACAGNQAREPRRRKRAPPPARDTRELGFPPKPPPRPVKQPLEPAAAVDARTRNMTEHDIP